MHAALSGIICSVRMSFCKRSFNSKALLDEVVKNSDEFKHNVNIRKSKIDIDRLLQLAGSDTSSEELEKLLKALPNLTYSAVASTSKPTELEQFGQKQLKGKRMIEAARSKGVLLQGKDYTTICGDRTYFLTGDLARLEQALVRFTLNRLKKHSFKTVSVPDILLPDQVESCGMATRGQRSQIYHVKLAKQKDMCLSGTSEIALANLFKSTTFYENRLPIKVCAASRCYRAEVSTVKEEKGLYRVHQFTKVEMFGLTEGNVQKSQELQEEFVAIQKSLFLELGLHCKVLDMPPIDLGKPAFRKIDFEAWMNGHGFYGEVSSTSDCTNYQSNRLGIHYLEKPVHTVNGTACAIPRMLIAIAETHLDKDDLIVPEVLREYMRGVGKIRSQPSYRKWKKVPYYFFESRYCD